MATTYSSVTRYMPGLALAGGPFLAAGFVADNEPDPVQPSPFNQQVRADENPEPAE